MALKKDFEHSLALVQASERNCESPKGSLLQADKIEDENSPDKGVNAVTTDQGEDGKKRPQDH
eukprot:CAMPEP_0184698304 /NCGR_PEP_ID=MMETSP0313-20130426/4974_1 /TAXON_ID=2792 /ORGANISM="Porphyridium aerugineum, Strain SAG 1380-2" /LENGTH=62 /DNA_ID=CAMNT_0027157223 /DNA_START=662 /DNA_END=850 /DNA_ORIENTATION=-